MKRTVESLTPPENKQVMWLDVSGKVKQLKTYINGEWVIVNDDTENNKEIVKTVLESIDKDFESYIKKEDADSKYVQQEVLDSDYVKKTYADSNYVTKNTLDGYITKSYADNTYATKDAIKDFITTTTAESTYAKITSLSDYIKSVDVENNYVSKTDTSYVKTETLDNYVTIETANSTYATQTALDGKIDKVDGKGLSTEDFTTEEKEKLASLSKDIDISGKVDKEEGKGLSTNDFTNDFKTKLEGIAEGATNVIVDDTIKESNNAIQNRAVNKAVNDLNDVISKKADTTALNSAVGRITALENNGATGVTVTESGEGNGIASIKNVGKNIVATKATFVTSLTGLATTAALNDGLAGKADVNHNHDTKYAAKEHTHPEYAQSSALNDYVTKTALDGKNFLTATSLNGYVNEVQPNGTSGNGIANITKEGKVLKVTKATFLTEHQSLDGYVNNVKVTGVANGNGIASIAKNGKDINVTQGAFLTAIDGIIAETGEAVAGSGVVNISIRGNKLVKKTGTFVTPATLGDAIDNYASNKGYLTENNLNEKLKETVTIKLVSDKSASDTNLNGAKVTVKSGNTTVSTQTWQGTPINVKVPCDKDVTIEAATVKMYVKPKALKYVPSPLYNREVTFTYKALELGVFIIDTNDNLINKDSWSSAMQETTVGVALITEKVAIVISAGIHSDLSWSKTEQLVGGVTTTTDKTVAETDYKGKANTEAIIKALGQNAPAAYYCSNYTFKNGKKGYLMAAGESKEIFVNIRTILELLEYINPDTINLGNGMPVWTSTQNDDIRAWNNDGISLRELPKKVFDKKYVVPIYSLYD